VVKLRRAALTVIFVAVAADSSAQPRTFNQDVARIFYDKCVTCHRPGEVAPMSLVTYEDARPWVRSIRARVAAREMPPWFADPRFGRAFVNDPRLTDAEIQAIVAWVDAGAPRGSGEAPAPPSFVSGWRTFKGRPPDAVVEMPAAFDIPANGALPVFTVWSPNPFTEDKFVEAVELRPGAVDAVHHSDVTARTLPAGTTLGRGAAWPGGPPVDFVPIYPDGTSYNELTADQAAARRGALGAEAFRTTDDYRLLFYVPGGGFQQFPPGAVKRISARNVLAWAVHYTPTGKPAKDQHRLGLWFADAPAAHEVITKRIGEAHIIQGKEFVAEGTDVEFPPIPPQADDWRITAITPILEDVTLYALWPHMHLRGKDMTFIATYPDGREEVLLHVPKYDFQWQLQYQLVEPLHLPAGSTIKAIGHYDNTSRNRKNPRPSAPVFWSEQSWDEMFNGWMDWSVDRDVIPRRKVYTLATPVNDRVSLAIGAGPPGKVYVRDADGGLRASGTIGPSPSFIEPWTFARGQTIQTEPTGADIGDVTVTLFDVPPDVTRTTTMGSAAVRVALQQPGQNGAVTFVGREGHRVSVHISGNTIRGVTVRLLTEDGRTTLASVTASELSFALPDVTLAVAGTYRVLVDPTGANIGVLNVSVAEK
jgi:mono/diheme cytochrome c family protein